MHFLRLGSRLLASEEGSELRQCRFGVAMLVFYFKENSERVEFVCCQRHLVVVYVRRDQSEEEFEVGLDEVQDNLVVIVHVVHFGNFGAWAGPQGQVLRILLHSPALLSKDRPCANFRRSLCSEELKCDKDCEAAHVDLIVGQGHVAIWHLILEESLLGSRTRVIDLLKESSVGDEVYVSILLGHVRDMSLGLIYPVDKFDLVVDRAEEIQIGERVDEHIG